MIICPWPSALRVRPAEQHPAGMPRSSQCHLGQLFFFYRAPSSACLLTGHQRLPFTLKVNPVEPNFILDSDILGNAAPQKGKVLFYSLLGSTLTSMSFLIVPLRAWNRVWKLLLPYVHLRQWILRSSQSAEHLSVLAQWMPGKTDFLSVLQRTSFCDTYYDRCDSDDERKILLLLILMTFPPSLGKPDFPN